MYWRGNKAVFIELTQSVTKSSSNHLVEIISKKQRKSENKSHY